MEFQDEFSEMTELQSTMIIDAAKARAKNEIKAEARNSWGSDMTAAIKLGLDKVSKLLTDIRTNRAHPTSVRSNRACIEDIMQSIAVQNHWMTMVQQQLDGLREQTKGFRGSAGYDDLDADQDDSANTNGRQGLAGARRQ